MGDTWPDGLPDEAYSRVTRDLASVTADFAAYLDDLPDRLTTRYRCRVRPLTRHERERVVRDLSDAAEGYAVEPDDPDCATVLVARVQEHDGATYAVLAFGVAASALIPDCLCDACDSDSAELIEQAEGFLEAALTGFREHRGPPRSTMPD